MSPAHRPHALTPKFLPITEYNTEVERALLLPKECAECPLGFDRQLADFGLAAPNECREMAAAATLGWRCAHLGYGR